jgi:hypothetical protein
VVLVAGFALVTQAIRGTAWVIRRLCFRFANRERALTETKKRHFLPMRVGAVHYNHMFSRTIHRPIV